MKEDIYKKETAKRIMEAYSSNPDDHFPHEEAGNRKVKTGKQKPDGK